MISFVAEGAKSAFEFQQIYLVFMGDIQTSRISLHRLNARFG
jgi:hypothetical protein